MDPPGFSLFPADLVIMFITPPRDEPQAEEAGPFMISMRSIMPAGIELVSAEPLFR